MRTPWTPGRGFVRMDSAPASPGRCRSRCRAARLPGRLAARDGEEAYEHERERNERGDLAARAALRHLVEDDPAEDHAGGGVGDIRGGDGRCEHPCLKRDLREVEPDHA